MDCTCQQWPMPCAHLAAACYALARSFDTDPFGALAWRGCGRDELLERLRQLRGAAEPASAPVEDSADAGLGDLADFWSSGTPSAATSAATSTGVGLRSDAILDQLDPLPLRAGGRPVAEILRPAYRALGMEPGADGI
jgi:uncharacterized Zn finger protein